MVSQPGGATKSSISPVPSPTPTVIPNGQQEGNGKGHENADNGHDSTGAGNTVNTPHKRHGDEPHEHHKVHKVVKPEHVKGGRTRTSCFFFWPRTRMTSNLRTRGFSLIYQA